MGRSSAAVWQLGRTRRCEPGYVVLAGKTRTLGLVALPPQTRVNVRLRLQARVVIRPRKPFAWSAWPRMKSFVAARLVAGDNDAAGAHLDLAAGGHGGFSGTSADF